MAAGCDTCDSDSESDTDLCGSPKRQKIDMGKTRYGGAFKYKSIKPNLRGSGQRPGLLLLPYLETHTVCGAMCVARP